MLASNTHAPHPKCQTSYEPLDILINMPFSRTSATPTDTNKMSSVAGMLNKLHGQPDSYDKKSQYRFGRTLGAGTYGIVREADFDGRKVAVKIILKKNVKGNEQMVYDELKMLQSLNHPHIVRFHDWFESRVWQNSTTGRLHANSIQDKYYIVTQLATGGELFDRICDQGKFTEKDAARTIKEVLEAVDYLHDRQIVHRGTQRH
jgi:calcium/calmodulin-dependent protein kinase I